MLLTAGIIEADGSVDVGLIERYLQQLPDKAMQLGMKIVLALIVFYIGITLIKWVRKIVKRALKKGNADQGVIQFLDSLIKVCLLIVLVLLIASGFGLETTSMITVFGSAGIAVGLAVQGSLSNFAGGVLILILKPFRVGDYIIEDTKNNEGTVTEISLFYTKLLTFDGKVVILPNGTLANSSLTNVTFADKRKIDLKVSISYGADIKLAKKVIMEILSKDPGVMQKEEKLVFVHELADSGVILGIRCMVKMEDYWTTRWRLNEDIKLALDANGVEIPYPQLDVHMK